MLACRRHSLKCVPSIILPYFTPSVLPVPPSPSTSCTLHPTDTYRLSRNVDPRMEERALPHFNSLDSRFLCREMSTAVARSMRSKVERRMRRESGKTLRELRRARKLKKKLMTNEERLLYNMRRAKKKISLLLQKLKKYDLPELPEPHHDPELFTPEQLQAYKKIGFKNKNYVPVGVRGVFGGVVLNMHLHWKFHETVQVCCDNFPREKIREMASNLARLSGGIVVNIHDVKTIIMFRGRNYRQPKVMTPVNTLTKRKALFKARFEQALESQKLNVKKIEQKLRQSGVNPDDPMAMASIQKVASTFFDAIDKSRGTPYVFRADEKLSLPEPGVGPTPTPPAEPAAADSDQEELDRFIAEIEEAADKDNAAEDAAEMEEFGRIRYLNRPDYGWSPRRYGMPSDDDRDPPSARVDSGDDSGEDSGEGDYEPRMPQRPAFRGPPEEDSDWRRARRRRPAFRGSRGGGGFDTYGEPERGRPGGFRRGWGGDEGGGGAPAWGSDGDDDDDDDDDGDDDDDDDGGWGGGGGAGKFPEGSGETEEQRDEDWDSE